MGAARRWLCCLLFGCSSIIWSGMRPRGRGMCDCNEGPVAVATPALPPLPHLSFHLTASFSLFLIAPSPSFALLLSPVCSLASAHFSTPPPPSLRWAATPSARVQTFRSTQRCGRSGTRPRRMRARAGYDPHCPAPVCLAHGAWMPSPSCPRPPPCPCSQNAAWVRSLCV